jgi:hypothetical protein
MILGTVAVWERKVGCRGRPHGSLSVVVRIAAAAAAAGAAAMKLDRLQGLGDI